MWGGHIRGRAHYGDAASYTALLRSIGKAGPVEQKARPGAGGAPAKSAGQYTTRATAAGAALKVGKGITTAMSAEALEASGGMGMGAKLAIGGIASAAVLGGVWFFFLRKKKA